MPEWKHRTTFDPTYLKILNCFRIFVPILHVWGPTLGLSGMLNIMHRAHDLEQAAKTALLTLTSPGNAEGGYGGF